MTQLTQLLFFFYKMSTITYMLILNSNNLTIPFANKYIIYIYPIIMMKISI